VKSIELFSGCGVFALGLAQAGFNHESMIEWNSAAVRTAKHNVDRGIDRIGHWKIVEADVRNLNWRTFPRDIDLLAGGPPCQPFSIGGKSRGEHDDRDMWPYAIAAVEAIRPKAFLFENVRGLTRPAFAAYLDNIVARLKGGDREEPGAQLYEIAVLRLNAADFGSAQKRHRVIISGIRTDIADNLQPLVETHSKERLLWDQWCSGEYWRRHDLAVPSDDRIAKLDLPTVKRLRKQGVCPAKLPWKTVRDALEGLGEPSGSNNHILQVGAKTYPGHTGSALDAPGKALKAGNHGVPGGENMMIMDDGSVRYFTVREAARLQGLPDDYEFPGSWSESMRQLGNAVPVQLGSAVGNWMAAQLRAAATGASALAA